MKKIFTVLLVCFLILSCSACQHKKETAKKENKTQESLKVATSKSLVVYFSWSGHTQEVAREIKEQTHSDIFEIIPDLSYSDDYDEVVDLAKKQQNEKARPEIKNKIEHFDDYDTIYLGYPIWWGDMPMILYTFLESYDLSNKTIAPFCTSASSGLSNTDQTIQSLQSKAYVKEGLHISSSSSDDCSRQVKEWLNKIK